MAPERFDNDPLINRADVYSLACVLTEMLSGDSPFPSATTVGQIIKAHLTAEPPKPSLARPHVISPRLDAVVARGMAKNPQHRFATVGARDALSVPDAPTMARPPAEPAPAGTTPCPTRPGSPRPRGGARSCCRGRSWWRYSCLSPPASSCGAGPPRTATPNSRGRRRPHPRRYRPTVLPFTNLKEPYGLAVDKDGNVYVADTGNDQVVKLVAG